ncbi:TetR/AcrR family transcriptional regulator [Williamsia sp. CHRR-6]|uniref:TetR/AcrR family transcriptional regulator n=1 Tax=Williamsia sp. CHRR-6 TaxID=2835871 RepID=UPI001BD95B5B|nr:TetR/AcrR family transcriptional regulator [Williamsia sp. CHRR-6]MBT0566568.1 TetR/AcrR family transcriptional regulator [Williamsia sp. CHRR-6]
MVSNANPRARRHDTAAAQARPTPGSAIATSKGRRTERAFVDAARVVFADKGYLNAKIADIAATAGRSTGSFYNYYDNKQQLLETLLDDFGSQVLERTRANVTDDPGTNIEQAVRAYWTTYRDYLPELIGAFQLSMTDEQFAQWWRERRSNGIHGVLSVFRSAQRSGVQIGLDKDLFASAIVSMLESFCWTWFVTGRDDNLADRDEDDAINILSEIWRRAFSPGSI